DPYRRRLAGDHEEPAVLPPAGARSHERVARRAPPAPPRHRHPVHRRLRHHQRQPGAAAFVHRHRRDQQQHQPRGFLRTLETLAAEDEAGDTLQALADHAPGADVARHSRQRRQPPRLLPVPLPAAAPRRSETALAREQPAVPDRPAPHADPPPHAGALGGQGHLGAALLEHGPRTDEARHLPLHAHLPLDAAQADPGPREAVLAPRRIARQEPVRGREAARRTQASDRARGAADSRTPGPVNLAASRVGALALFGPYCRREWVLADDNALLEYSDAGRHVLMRARDDSPAMRELLLNIDREV